MRTNACGNYDDPIRCCLESYLKMYSGNDDENVKGNTFVDTGRELEGTLKP